MNKIGNYIKEERKKAGLTQEEFDYMPEFEDLAMRLAELMGIQTVPHALIKMNDEYAYITKRVDRDIEKKEIKLYAMEDFCQLSNRLTQDKYKGSYENCGRIIKKNLKYWQKYVIFLQTQQKK